MVGGFREERRQGGGLLRGAVRGGDLGGAAGVGVLSSGFIRVHNGWHERLTGVAGSGKAVRGVSG